MGRTFNVGRMPNGDAPNVIALPYTTGQTFKKGALLVTVAAGTVSECGADPTKVVGVSGIDAGTGPGFGMSDNITQVTGREQVVSVQIADRSTVFTCRGINGATDPVTPAITNIQEKYGVAKVGVDWVMDMAETTALVVHIVDVDVDAKIFFVKFLEAVLDMP